MVFLTLAMTAWQRVAASTMQQLIESGDASVCAYSTEIIVSLIMLPLVQFQTLSRVSSSTQKDGCGVGGGGGGSDPCAALERLECERGGCRLVLKL